MFVVDDEATLTDLLAMALRYKGCEVSTAATGQAAIRTAAQVKPDAIILDVMLPDLSGFEVLRRVRSGQPDVPVLFLTARDAVEDRT